MTKETAKEAFATAIEWHVVKKFNNVSINDGGKSYSIAEFASILSDPTDQSQDCGSPARLSIFRPNH